MVNISYVADSGDMIATPDGSDPVLYNLGDISFIIVASALVMFMAPGVGLFYSGLLRRKNALSMLFVAMMVYCVVSVQWMFWGYSLAFGPGTSGFIGDLTHFGLINVLDDASVGSTRIPALLYSFYQNMFATDTAILAFGAVAERGRLGPLAIVVFLWTTLVYDPIACWVWNPNGWAYILGSYDFAGGGPVHLNCGAAALAYSIYIGKRRGFGTAKLAFKPHNTTYVFLGTVMLWFGWFGFNGGSAFSANLRAVQACIVTNLSAAMGGLSWCLLDYRLERRWSAVGMASGIISGLVGITPAAGYVGSPAALAIGFVSGIACNLGTGIKNFIADEPLDIFAIHGVGGIVGLCMTALFADSRVAGFDGTTDIPGGWINRHWIQLGYQLAEICAIFGWSFVVTYLIVFVVDHIPGCHLRASDEAEIIGIDEHEIGEVAYDYALIEREVERYYVENDEFMDSQDKKISPAAHHALDDSLHPARDAEGMPVTHTKSSGNGSTEAMREKSAAGASQEVEPVEKAEHGTAVDGSVV